ncbi:hypothetical protein H6G80_14670 [Nostoc sp. FACHB-87]|uniref:hypothetical protein n=1 Tax=Nostocales TaxID=1161 RepID=UPI001688D080|nr:MULTISPECIES: hypothetical protein [Nostocales]MBD2455319.1 hypothetical protein [Nostoc sp. FACHB-87]MBD2476856.1 hypothetical protein [Anabaena sp. FACHB-83]MBD2489237.1 hypothetical protein [Aulosira sp. FACHB-615]
MKTPIADKTPVPPKIWRRHSDPPSLWIFVAVSSVSLHLLVFWLMRSSNALGVWFPAPSQAIVPIEVVEISPTAKSTLPKTTVSPKPNNSSPKSVARTETAKTTPRNQDANPSILKQKEPAVSPKNTKPKPSVKKSVSQPKPTPKPSFTPDLTKSPPQPKPTPTVPVGNLPWNRRQKIVLGTGTPLPNSLPTDQATNSPTGTKKNPPTPNPTGTTSDTPTPRNPQTSPSPASTNSQTSPQVGSTVKIVPLADQEMRQLSQDLPDVLAQYQGSSIKTLPVNSLNGEQGLAPAELLASLVIDQNGNFQEARVLEIQPATLQAEKNLYQQAINELFSNDKFIPAYNQDGSKPELSNLFVKITIQSVNSN